jgi:hypothetical protein
VGSQGGYSWNSPERATALLRCTDPLNTRVMDASSKPTRHALIFLDPAIYRKACGAEFVN